MQLKALQLPIGSNYLRCKNFNAQDANSAILNVYQIGPFSYESSALLDLLKDIAAEPFYHNLRTVEQLAYGVSFMKYNTDNCLGYKISVNSQESKFTAEYVDERIENFRRILATIIENMSQNDFDAIRESKMKEKSTEFKDLMEEVEHNWTQIELGLYEFDQRHKEIECLKSMTKQRLLAFYRAHYGQNERKLSVQIIGNAHANNANHETAKHVDFDHLSYVAFNGESKGHLVDDYMEFKNRLDIYPTVETTK